MNMEEKLEKPINPEIKQVSEDPLPSVSLEQKTSQAMPSEKLEEKVNDVIELPITKAKSTPVPTAVNIFASV